QLTVPQADTFHHFVVYDDSELTVGSMGISSWWFGIRTTLLPHANPVCQRGCVLCVIALISAKERYDT
ncbi:hypothetical protein JXQ70_12230, partial [bacterium]|nr:hypothetical protein [bacterium]